jgi:regulator of protease activity HflC (stomatin/prohibitin superfamily)
MPGLPDKEENMEYFWLYVLIAIILIVIIRNIKVVPQANAYIVERLGAYMDTWGVACT